MGWTLRILKKPNTGWEFTVIEGSPVMVNEQMPKFEKQGWELAGDVAVKSKDVFNVRITVPLKRKK